jgi:hypothetical protein
MTFHAHKLKTFSFLAAFALVFASGGLFGAQPDDRVVIYDMKDDPTLPQFVGNAAATGFYGLEIDEYRREGTILFRVVFRRPTQSAATWRSSHLRFCECGLGFVDRCDDFGDTASGSD